MPLVPMDDAEQLQPLYPMGGRPPSAYELEQAAFYRKMDYLAFASLALIALCIGLLVLRYWRRFPDWFFAALAFGVRLSRKSRDAAQKSSTAFKARLDRELDK